MKIITIDQLVADGAMYRVSGGSRSQSIASHQDLEHFDIELPAKDTIIKNVVFRKCNFKSKAVSEVGLHFVDVTLENCSIELPASSTLHFELNCSVVDSSISKCISAIFSKVTFSKSRIQLSSETTFENVTFGECNISGRCEQLTVKRVHFSSGKWNGAGSMKFDALQFVFADLAIVEGDSLAYCSNRDEVDVQNAKVIDTWADLRDTYTGLSQFLIIIGSLVFFAPYAIKLFILNATARIVDYLPESAYGMQPLWQALFLGNSSSIWLKYGYSALAAILVLYNFGRIVFTVQVSRLREREEHLNMLGYKRTRPRENVLSRMKSADQFLRYIGYGALIAGFVRLVQALLVSVPVV